MKKIHRETGDFKKVTIISAHEGSYSWVRTLSFMEGYINLNYITIISDAEYRSSNFIRRIVNKIFIYLVFPLKVLALYKRIHREDFIIVITSPFYLPILAALLFKSEKLLVLHNDLYPEGFSRISFLNKIPFLFGFYRYLSDKLLHKISKNIFLSKSHFRSREYLNKCIIHTPAVSREIRETEEIIDSPMKYHVGYFGTLGYNHSGIEFLHLFNHSNLDFQVEFNFNISGALANEFKSLVLDCNDSYNSSRYLKVSGSLDESDYHNAMLNTDFGLILLSPNGGDTVFPSKFAAHLSYGHPIILISDQKNDLHDFVIKNAIGVSISLSSKNLNCLNDYMSNISYKTVRNNSLFVYEKYFHYENIGKAFLKEMNLDD